MFKQTKTIKVKLVISASASRAGRKELASWPVRVTAKVQLHSKAVTAKGFCPVRLLQAAEVCPGLAHP